ncbi:hypothetical protein BC477_10610 [Clavibacter michiganensis subsp. michiganensis]|uniref:Uncharacterized protein n=1 Tax=Clavibacter michiganensis subsp. michiganensis TaxID=33013 RepID=A0A251XP00_CLAMM|nr:hypothetical protein BC477_10610 [Clavibacter michiganensis subsp. michiganensis]OUE05177.1 hypothetical protein CMMCAS07_09530 [Clavibacter michiganensis subsp. michiganensis]
MAAADSALDPSGIPAKGAASSALASPPIRAWANRA